MSHATTVQEAVVDLLPGLRARAAGTDRDRRLPAETVAELQEAGVFRWLQPQRHGGLEGDPLAFYEAVRSLSAACGSTGWVAAALGVHPWHLALFPGQAQDDVWGADPGALLCSSYTPAGELVEVEGGFHVSGRWSFASGAAHCGWALLGAVVPGEDGIPADFVTLLLPRSDYVVDPVWDAVGLKGAGCDDVVVEGAFVPTHRVLSFRRVAARSCPGQDVNTAPLYRLPFGTVFSDAVTAPLIGIADEAVRAHIEWQRPRVRTTYGGQRVSHDPHAHVRVARAASEVDAAWLQLQRNLQEQVRLLEAGEDLPTELRLRTRRDQVLGTERCTEAVSLLFTNSGGRALASGSVLERTWRDVHAGSVHAANDAERWLALWGKGSFGLSTQEVMV